MKTIYIGTILIDSIIKNIDSNPVSASGYTADSAGLFPGGEALNGATTLARLIKSGKDTASQDSVAVLGFLGNDPAGKLLTDTLISYGVDISDIIVSESAGTPVSTLIVNEDGTRRSVTNSAHRYNFHPEKYTGCFSGADNIVLASLFRAPFNDSEIIYQVLKAAKENGITTYADTKLPNFVKLTLDDIKDSLPLIDYITPNRDETAYYTGESDPIKAADVFLNLGVKNVIIKLGGDGCIMKNADSLIELPAYNVNVVDTTGSGDAFLAGFIATGDIHFANACGAICASRMGASGSIAGKDEVVSLMTKADLISLF